MRTREEKEVMFREMREKYAGKPEGVDLDPHYKVPEVALMLGIGETTVRRYIKGNPKLKRLNPTGKRRAPLISTELLRELYDRLAG